MRGIRSVAAFSLALTAAVAIGTGSASASVQLGNSCTADSFGGNQIYFDPATSTSPFNGIVVSWGYGIVETFTNITGRRLVVLKRSAEPSKWEVVSISNPLFDGPFDGGFAATPAAIPIAAGQVLGIWNTGPLVPGCVTTSDSMFYLGIASLPSVGLTLTEHATTNVTSAVFATVEPDADGDGTGDETQDKCPQSTRYSTACPTLSFSASRTPSAKAFRLLTTSSIEAPVSAVGTVKLPKRKMLRFQSQPVTAQPGALTVVKLTYPRQLTNALKKLSKKKSLTAQIVVTAKGITNDVVKNYKVKLKGTRPKKR